MKSKLLTTISIFISITSLTAQVQIESDIHGFTSRDQCGHELAISNAGDVLAGSSYFNNANGYDAGRVRVFERNGSAWARRGASLLGDSIDDTFGFAVDLNASGTAFRYTNQADINTNGSSGHIAIVVRTWSGGKDGLSIGTGKDGFIVRNSWGFVPIKAVGIKTYRRYVGE